MNNQACNLHKYKVLGCRLFSTIYDYLACSIFLSICNDSSQFVAHPPFGREINWET